MACMQDKRKKDLELVTRLAKQFAAVINEPVRIYKANCISIGEYFDFEPTWVNDKRDTVEIITQQL